MRISNVTAKKIDGYVENVTVYFYVKGVLKTKTRTLKPIDVDEIYLKNLINSEVQENDVDLLINLLEISRVIEIKNKSNVISENRYHNLKNLYFTLILKYKFYERQELLII